MIDVYIVSNLSCYCYCYAEWVAGIMGWLINVGANFAHVSPTYTYSSVYYTDNYADIIDLAEDVFNYYLMNTIKQCYKVVFSMHLLGDPSLLLHQWKTGLTDIVIKTGKFKLFLACG